VYGVCFAVSNSFLSKVEPCGNSPERLMTLCINTTSGPINHVSVYTPTLSATPYTKDGVYENLASIICRNIASREQLFILGDLNARESAHMTHGPLV